jgi:hypothetical protein
MNLGWDFSKDKTRIEIMDNTGKVLMSFSIYEILDGSDPDLIITHLETIRTCSWEIGEWQKYYGRKTLEKFES